MHLTPSGAIFILVVILMVVLMIIFRRRKTPEPETGLPEYKACPHCAEPIRVEARVCKHCGRNVIAEAK